MLFFDERTRTIATVVMYLIDHIYKHWRPEAGDSADCYHEACRVSANSEILTVPDESCVNSSRWSYFLYRPYIILYGVQELVMIPVNVISLMSNKSQLLITNTDANTRAHGEIERERERDIENFGAFYTDITKRLR